MESPSDVLDRLGGRARFAELIQVIPKRKLAAAVRDGTVQRLARGLYGLPGRSPDQLAAIDYDGVVSHLSAALAWKLPLLTEPKKPHITVPKKRRPRSGLPAVLHWAATSAEEQSSRLTSLVRTVTDCARILPFDQTLAVADAGLRLELTRRELTAATTAMRGAGCTNARRVAALATASSESFLESMLRALLIQNGIEGFEPQVMVGRGLFRARVDLGHRQAQVALEAEGYEYHGSSSDFAADCRRYDELIAAGWLVLRFTYHQVIFEPDWVVDMIQEAASRPTGHSPQIAGANHFHEPGEPVDW